MSSRSGKADILGLLGWFLLTFVAAAIGSKASTNASTFYADLVQPGWAPPPWLFGPVWAVLYTLIAIAAWLVWRSGRFEAQRVALSLFVVQLALNALWSWLFFAWNRGAMAFVEIIMLWLAIVATLVTFWRVRPLAGALFVPYLIWVSFAAALNFALWRLNPQILG
jgi:tryptophan-rich sensory protein